MHTVHLHFSDFLHLEVLSNPVEIMIADEIMTENHLLKEKLNPSKKLDELVKCICKIFLKYQLLCRHIFL